MIRKTIIAWDNREREALEEIMQTQDLGELSVLRQALAHYQVHCRRVWGGETCIYSGDAQRTADFTGSSQRDLGEVDLSDIFGTPSPYTLRDFLAPRLATSAMMESVVARLTIGGRSG